MATMEELESALIKADAAGNADDAKVFADEIRRMRAQTPNQSSQPAQDQPGVTSSLGQGFSNGFGNVVFGGQQLLGKGAKAIGLDKAGDFLINDAQQRINTENQKLQPYKDANPIATGIGQFGGEMVGTAIPGGAAAKGIGLAGKAVGLAKYTDPLASSVLTGGMRVGGQTGAKALATRATGGAVNGGLSGALIDPNGGATTGAITGALVPTALPAIGKGLGWGTKQFLGATTGVGPDAVSAAYNAGKKGSQAFLDNMRGNVDMANVVEDAKKALGNIKKDRADQYRKGMLGVKADKTVLNFQPIDDGFKQIVEDGTFKGRSTRKSTENTINKINDELSEWRVLTPSEYHTPEGFDALKQLIGDIRSGTEWGSPSRNVADQMYHTVRQQVAKQAPEYDSVMRNYNQASDLINELSGTFSLTDKSRADTTLRKLQSVMRNNVTANYGNRGSLMQELQEKGGADIIPALAGQAMNTWTPRGLVGAIQSRVGAPAAALGSYLNPAMIPAALGAGLVSSPRAVGYGMYGAGRVANGIRSGLLAVPPEMTGIFGAKVLPTITVNAGRDSED